MRPDWSVAATRNPYREQLDKLLDAQERAPAKVEDYLARPRWGPLFLPIGGQSAGDGGEVLTAIVTALLAVLVFWRGCRKKRTC